MVETKICYIQTYDMILIYRIIEKEIHQLFILEKTTLHLFLNIEPINFTYKPHFLLAYIAFFI